MGPSLLDPSSVDKSAQQRDSDEKLIPSQGKYILFDWKGQFSFRILD